MQVHSYNDAAGYLSDPSAFHETYMRGAWINNPDGSPRDCQRFFLGVGVDENWSTLEANINRIPSGVKIGFRIIDFRSPISNMPTVTVRGFAYPDFGSPSVRTFYRDMLLTFKARFPRITWIDIPFPYAPSNEPSITEDDCRQLGGGDLARGKARYFEDAKWLIDTYVAVFGRAVVGNLIPDTWIADVLLPYQQIKGIRAFRQDSFGRYNWQNEGIDGENRATCYDRRIAQLGGRDAFDRLILEVTGNGINAQGNDQSTGAHYPMGQMFTYQLGEYYQLEATDCGNMGLPASWVESYAAGKRRLDAWYAYIGEPITPPVEPPGDGGNGPIEPPTEWPKYVEHEGVPLCFARIDEPQDVVSLFQIHSENCEQVTYPNSPETAAFLRRIAEEMEK